MFNKAVTSHSFITKYTCDSNLLIINYNFMTSFEKDTFDEIVYLQFFCLKISVALKLNVDSKLCSILVVGCVIGTVSNINGL